MKFAFILAIAVSVVMAMEMFGPLGASRNV